MQGVLVCSAAFCCLLHPEALLGLRAWACTAQRV